MFEFLHVMNGELVPPQALQQGQKHHFALKVQSMILENDCSYLNSTAKQMHISHHDSSKSTPPIHDTNDDENNPTSPWLAGIFSLLLIGWNRIMWLSTCHFFCFIVYKDRAVYEHQTHTWNQQLEDHEKIFVAFDKLHWIRIDDRTFNTRRMS